MYVIEVQWLLGDSKKVDLYWDGESLTKDQSKALHYADSQAAMSDSMQLKRCQVVRVSNF